MAYGVVGRELKAAFARSSTWGTPASVTRQLLLQSTDGFDANVSIVDDPSFNQNFLKPGEVADQMPTAAELQLQARYEDVDTFIAAAMGSAAAPTVVSSVAANSLVAYSHAITLAVELTHFFTIAIDFQNYILEVPTAKIRGYSLRVGENGRMNIAFQMVGAKTNYDSSVNTNSTVAGAREASLGNRLFRKDGRVRINVQDAAALGSSDELAIVKEIAFGTARPVSDDDFVFNQDYIIEPDDNDFPEYPVEVTYARMTTPAANSLVIGLKAGRVFKMDWFFQGPYINSTTRRSLLFEFPSLQIRSARLVAAGPGQVQPVATYHAKAAQSAPSGMAFTNPFRATLINANSQNLLA
jgi:hypothetical protein